MPAIHPLVSCYIVLERGMFLVSFTLLLIMGSAVRAVVVFLSILAAAGRESRRQPEVVVGSVPRYEV